jgi:hypothetical protein
VANKYESFIRLENSFKIPLSLIAQLRG